MQTTTTEICVRDPSAVALVASDGREALPASRAPQTAPLASGRTDLGSGSSAAYQVNAQREDSGAIAVDWSSSLPLANGERHTLLPANGILVAKEPLASIVTPSRLAASRLVLPTCTWLTSHGYRGVSSYSVEALATAHCDGDTAVRASLDIPWDGVEIQERTHVDHGGAWLIVGVATLAFGVFATLFFTTPPKDWTGGQATQLGLGVATTAIGLAFDLAMLPSILTPDRGVVLQR